MKVFSNGGPKVLEEFHWNSIVTRGFTLAMAAKAAANSISVITLIREAFIESVKVIGTLQKLSLVPHPIASYICIGPHRSHDKYYLDPLYL